MIKDVLYHLKQDYGLPVTVYQIVSTDVNINSGVVRNVVSFKQVPLAVVLPGKTARKLLNKGLAYDFTTRTIMIDNEDLGDLRIRKDDYVIFNGLKYLVNEVISYEDFATLVTVKESDGAYHSDTFETSVTIELSEGTTDEL